MTEDEFRNIAWFYFPGTTNAYGWRHTHWLTYPLPDNSSFGAGGSWISNESPRVWTDNVNAVYEPITNTTVTSYEQIGSITVEFNHLGKDEISSVKIPVYYEVRKWPKFPFILEE